MAKIDTYDNTQGLSIGGVNHYGELATSAKETSHAISAVSNTLSGFADGLLSERRKAEAKAEAEAKNLDNLRVHSAMLDHTDRVKSFAAEAAANYTGEGATGQGYTKAVSDYATKDAQSVIRTNFGNRDDQEALTYHFQDAAHGVVEKANELELNTGLKFHSDVSERKVAGLMTKIAVDPASFESAKAELNAFMSSTNIDRPELQARLTSVGMAKLDRAHIESIAALNPKAFIAATAGAFRNSPRPDLPQHIKDVVNSTNNTSVDPHTMLDIGYIEGGLDPKAGRPGNMSTAEGMFQVLDDKSTLDELGITKDQRYDTALVSSRLAAYIQRKTEVMQRQGIPVTPGKQYMFWNMGPGVALATMKSDPNVTIDTIINRVLSNYSPAYRATFLRNNPSMYKSGMKAGEVVTNYEKQMSRASAATAKYLTDNNVEADDAARKFFEKITPGGAPNLGARDLGEIYVQAQAKHAQATQEQQSLDRGASFISGDTKPDPRDEHAQKDVNEAVLKYGMANGLVEGDPEAHRTAAKLTENVGFAPDAMVNAYSSALAGGDLKSKSATYASLADLEARNPGAYSATKLPAKDRERIDHYVALTTVSQLSPQDAIRSIDYHNSPEGKKQADAERAGLQSTRGTEIKALTELDVTKHFDEKWTSSNPTDAEGKFISAAFGAYKEMYTLNREAGRSVDDSKAMALSSLDKNWGSSRVADTGRGANTQTFMPFPPEKFNKPTDVGLDWITDQAKNSAAAFVEQRYPNMAREATAQAHTSGLANALPDTATLKGTLGIKLVPDIETAHEVRSNSPVGYMLMVRLPNGTTDISPTRFYPDQKQADNEASARFIAGNRKTRNASKGFVASPIPSF